MKRKLMPGDSVTTLGDNDYGNAEIVGDFDDTRVKLRFDNYNYSDDTDYHTRAINRLKRRYFEEELEVSEIHDHGYDPTCLEFKTPNGLIGNCLIEPTAGDSNFVSQLATEEKLLDLQARIKPKDNYYAFPGGVEVKDISAHLTSFGGQALQYVARATRLDGKNKGEQVKDLTKAIDFIQWEIERLENE